MPTDVLLRNRFSTDPAPADPTGFSLLETGLYERIRVVLSAAPAPSSPVRLVLVLVGEDPDGGAIAELENVLVGDRAFTRVYDVPGTLLDVQVASLTDSAGSGEVVVYGWRPN